MSEYKPGVSGKGTVYTSPRSLVSKLDKEFGFTVDVCAIPENAQCPRFFSPLDNALQMDWAGQVCWMNPPWGKGIIGAWVDKAIAESQGGKCIVVAIVPARTSSPWWHVAVKHAAQCRFPLHKTYFKETLTGKHYIPFLGMSIFVFNGRGPCQFSLMEQ